MIDSRVFENEIAQIKDDSIKDFVRFYFDAGYVPDYFFQVGASSSGKYHPQFAQGNGGLVRHTKAAFMFAQEFLRMSSYSYMKDIYKDYALAAILMHDTAKYGIEEFDKEQYASHGENASININKAWRDMYNEEAPYLLTHAIASHMGQWSIDEKPFTPVDRLVHLADYVASRNFIDIPCLEEVK